MEDWIARGIAIAGVLGSFAGIALTLYLWSRSGPNVAVSAFVLAERSTLHVEVANKGRIAATIRSVEIRDQTDVRVPGSSSSPGTFSRWTQPLRVGNSDEPIELAPTAFFEVDYPISSILLLSSGASTVKVSAWVQRGDGKWTSSKVVQVR